MFQITGWHILMIGSFQNCLHWRILFYKEIVSLNCLITLFSGLNLVKSLNLSDQRIFDMGQNTFSGTHGIKVLDFERN